MKILSVFGTRPEAIKMAPLVKALETDARFDARICVTGQHRQMLDQVLEIFEIFPNFDLNVMEPSQSLSSLTSKIILGMEKVFNDFKPNMLLVHGDTTTTFSASIASFYNQIPIGHVEAGLRTGDLYSPWPEEANRKITGTISSLHFTPTKSTHRNLINEGIPSNKIFITGNTVIDALFLAKRTINSNQTLSNKIKNSFHFLDDKKKLILVTGHRRESFGKGIEDLCRALKKIAMENPSVQIVYPVHMNPHVIEPVKLLLSGVNNIFLIEPLEYLYFVYLMNKSYIIITDSGGIQEEAPSLGKPVLVTRDVTERPEAISAGTVMLVGTNIQKVYQSVQDLLHKEDLYKRMSSAHNPYGDGNSSALICDILGKQNVY